MGVIFMPVLIDIDKGKKAAELLYNCFSGQGIFGHNEMPEDLLPSNVVPGSLEHIMFITLTVSIDYQRDAISLWEASRKTFEDIETRYLYSPIALHETKNEKIVEDMNKYGLSKKHKQDAWIWKTVGVTFYKKWEGNPVNFLKHYNHDAQKILEALKNSTHLNNGRNVADYPFLRGNKIGPLWIRMLRDNVGIEELKNLDRVPIPVDIHVARSSLALGIVKGDFEGRLDVLFEYIREAWHESVKDLNLKERPMVALDVDEPLWHLSKYGCTAREKTEGHCPLSHICEAKDLCNQGMIKIENGKVEINT
jgi:hypothetical protein